MTDEPSVRSPSLPDLREEYSNVTEDLDLTTVSVGWVVLLEEWIAQAWQAGVPDANAMVLATVDGQGHPATRSVLCKGVSEDGIDFYTHYASTKGQHIARYPYGSVTFPWYGLSRQVHLRGDITRLDHDFSQGYWSHRPRGSQLGAWASEQSKPIESLSALQQQLRNAEKKFSENADVPLPTGWGGYRLIPREVEFWQGRASRLHNRIALKKETSGWVATRLQP